MEIRLLGSGGWLPTDRRETACVYFRDGADVLLLDAGTGLRRLVTEPALLDGVERLSVALSHFHLDHVCGLIGLPAFRGLAAREVWAPGRLVAGAPAAEVVERLLGPPFLGGSRADVHETMLTAVHELEGDVEIGPFRVETRVQPLHKGPTIALRVNGTIAYCTDTAYDVENVAFARGAEVLLHEAFHAADSTDDTMHSAAGEAGRVAAAAGVGRLLLCHVNPLLAADDELVGHARRHFPQAEVAIDGPVDGAAA